MIRAIIYIVFVLGAIAGWLVQKFKRPPKLSKHPQAKPSLQHPHWQQRLAALHQLARNPENISIFADVMGDRDGNVAEAAAQGLASYGDDAIPLFLTHLNSEQTQVREVCAKYLANFPRADVREALMHSLQTDESAWVRIAAAQALGEISNKQVIAALIDALDDPHAEVVKAIRETLAQIDTPQTRKALKKIN